MAAKRPEQQKQENARRTLGDFLCEGPESALLWSEILGVGRVQIYAESSRILKDEELAKYQAVQARRKAGMPLQYALGRWNFYGEDIAVDARALIPRPETEQLVEWVLEDGIRDLDVWDVGTGTGVIALMLARHATPHSIHATDISEQALSLAKENEQLLQQSAPMCPITWVLADLLPPQVQADVIVSNPPYVPDAWKEQAQPELLWEPQNAIYAGADGLDVFRVLIPRCKESLRPGGRVYFEMGHDQKDALSALLHSHGFLHITCRQDYSGHDRMIRAELGKDADSCLNT